MPRPHPYILAPNTLSLPIAAASLCLTLHIQPLPPVPESPVPFPNGCEKAYPGHRVSRETQLHEFTQRLMPHVPQMWHEQYSIMDPGKETPYVPVFIHFFQQAFLAQPSFTLFRNSLETHDS